MIYGAMEERKDETREGNDALGMRDREPVTSLFLYRALKWIVIKPIMTGYFRFRSEGLEHIPRRGPFVVVSNHASNVDPPILACGVNRPLAFMAKEELFRVPILKDIIRTYGAYPVKRGAGDRSAIRAAMRSLQEGWGVGIFLEGTRTEDGRVNDPKLGAALIAAKAQVPIIPACLCGSEKIFVLGSSFPRPAGLTLRVGPAIAPPATTRKGDLQAKTEECARKINALHDLGR